MSTERLQCSEVPVEIKRFSQETREALEKQGFVIYGLTEQSIKTLRNSGRKFRSTWHKNLPSFEALGAMRSEVAINPKKLFLPKSNRKRLSQQEKMVEQFSQELGKKIQGVKAIIGQVPDYVELVFAHLDATGEYLFGAKDNYHYARTRTRLSSSYVSRAVACVGNFDDADSSLYILYFHANRKFGLVYAAPLVVPA